MTKMRLHELAKELGITSKELISYLGSNYTVQSGLTESEVARARAKHEEVQRGKSLEKKAVLLKAPKKDSVQKPAETAQNAAAEEKPAEAKKEQDKQGEQKPKKPVFVFRPENSRTGLGDKLKTQNPKKPAEKEKPKTAVTGRIKPNVPTTAEQYRDMSIREAEEAKEKEKEALEAEKAAEEAKKQAEKEIVPETKPEKQIPPEEKAEKEPIEPAKEEKKEPVSAPPAESAASVKPSDSEKKAGAHAAEKPRQAASVTTEKDAEKIDAPEKKKETAPSAEKVSRPESKNEPEKKKPALTIVGKVDLNRVKESEEAAKNAKKNPFQKSGSKVHFVDNRNKDGKTDGYRKDSYQKDKDANGKPGSKNSNRGIFAKDGNRQNSTHVHVNTAAGSDKVVSKTDVRGKKSNFKSDKDRNNFDKNGKKAENFKNLTKDYSKKSKTEQEEEVIKMIVLPETVTIKDLADKMKMKSSDLIKKLFMQGKMMTVNSELSYEDAEAIALEYDILCEKEVQVDVIEELLKEEDEDEKLMIKRPPVVCVMGHVDHGKTSLLDAIRKTNVISREAGGITQHIGAYMVECKGEKITFLDTPGHEAFTAMRMRGAMATDIAILVVAADDGVMPQTVEAINHAKAAGVDVIVAVNKIDKPTANVDKVKQELMEYGLVSEEWGGSTIFVPVSAKTGQNIDSLLEMILLVTEVKELKANPNREMRGIVIEAKLDKGRGPVATVLVQKGTLKAGDFVSAGSTYGRVRAMLDADGNTIKAALPSTPVEILGLNGVPNAGEICIGHKNEKDARGYAETFIAEEKKKMLAETKHKLTLDTLFSQIKQDSIKELPIVLKADVQGSVEALKTSLEKLSNEEVAVRVIHGAVGAINESDVTLASASNAIVIGFNVKPDAQAKTLAEQEAVDLRLYRVIYQAIDDVEYAMKGMLAPVYEEKILGHAEIRVIFKASGIGNIAGSYVLDGTLERGCKARITRDKEVIFDGNVASLKRFKDDVKEVREGYECGIVFEKFNDIQEGDLVEGYKMVQVEREK